MTTHMTTHVPALVHTHDPGHVYAPVLPDDMAEKVADLRKASKAENTQRAYQSDWRRWSTWCEAQGFIAMPAHADTVSAYLADQATTCKVATLSRHLATISKAHQVAGVANPCRETKVRDTMSGLRKTYGVKQAEAPGLLADSLRITLSHIPDDLSGRRDRALLVVGFLAGLRRSEIAGLTWGDIDTESERDGVVVTLAKSKTDQERQGRSIGLHKQADEGLCPFVTLSAWRNALGEIDAAHIEKDAPVFVQVTRWGTVKPGHMTGNTIALVIQKRAMKAGLSVQYQGHSLRKGFVQSAHKAGVSIDAVMATTGHKSVKMVMRYQSQVPVMSQSASKGLLA